jgi:hypothetical protein
MSHDELVGYNRLRGLIIPNGYAYARLADESTRTLLRVSMILALTPDLGVQQLVHWSR